MTRNDRFEDSRRHLPWFSFLLLLLQAAEEDLGQIVELGKQLVQGITLSRLVPGINARQALDQLGLTC